MGLFSKTKTYVESASSAMFTEGRSSTVQSVFGAITQDRSISDDLLTNALNGLGRKARQFYKYGDQSYTYGLPEGTQIVKSGGASAINAVLIATVDESAKVVYSIFDKADPELFAREHLVNNRGYDTDTNIVSNPPFTTGNEVTLYSCEWISSTQIVINYLYDTSTNLESETISVPSTDIEEFYYHVGYTTSDSPDINLYWFYKASLGTYETLNVNVNEKVSEYYPIVPIRRDNIDMTDSSLKDTDLFKTSKRLLSKLGIDFEEVGVGVNTNPDIDGVDHCYLNISAPIQSDSKFVQEYLYAYFLDLFKNQEYDKEYYEAELGTSRNAPLLNRIIVSELENGSPEKGYFNTELAFSYIESSIITGSIGRIGSVSRETVLADRYAGKYYAIETSYMLWNHQISSTEYRQLKVVGLQHINNIYGSKSVDTTLEDSLTVDNDDFNIMVNKRIVESFPIHKQNDIINDTVRLCFNSVERVKLKWYQSTIFKAIIIIVAAVITVLSGGSGAGLFAKAVLITGATSFIVQLAIAIIINTLLSVLITKLADVVGLRNAAILVIIYTVYSIASGSGPVMTGDNLVTLASGIGMSSNFYIKDRYATLVNEYDQMKAEQEADQAELDELLEALPSSQLDPMALLKLDNYIGFANESPEDYYNTRIHTGNIGTLAYAEISRYVESNITLEGITDRVALNIL